ncbi:leucine-rich repeat receptor-like tyrosine-protein kinase PXC3 [Silene latifolia]|uniref:leucine-rich repeat receptor-like tyrosine-protein kinase PXC3 n=1 Tax=Silene latifolia TaxID=37657 RepID=UPI003D787527
MCSTQGKVSWSILVIMVAVSCKTVSSELPDQSIMFAINEEIGVPGWGVNNSDYCYWTGIQCGVNQTVQIFDLSNRWLRGNVTLISELKALKWLDLSSNYFTGPIPAAFGDLTHLEFLDLSVNKFGSNIPLELGNLKNLKALNLSYNFLVGEIPNELEGLVELQEFQISGNRFNGSIPQWVGNLTNLKLFAAYENSFGGLIPDNLGSVSQLELLNLHSNQLQGSIPESLFSKRSLVSLVLTQNKLTGTIPDSIGSCDNLSSIRVGNNNLTGNIPKTVGNITSLTYFEVNNNNLSGELVVNFARCSNLTLLNLASNGFTGSIPPELGQLANLQELIFSENSLFGDIPESVLHNRYLNKLDLSNNRFNGSIPVDICSTSRLQFLLLSQNSLRGEIPHEIGSCVKLLELQLASNYLTGTIPPEIGRLKNLQIALNLSFNHLHGPLPSELGKLDKLVALDVSNNRLSGPIPTALKGMLSLLEVNFSNNLFAGPIPVFVPFQKSQNSSFQGNNGLCGQPLSSCGSNDDEEDNYPRKVSYRIILAVIGSGLVVFICVTVVVLLFMMRERQEISAKDDGVIDDSANNKPLIAAGNVFVDNYRQAIDFEAVVKATFKDENKLSSGTFSSVFKATMPSGLVLLVRSLKSVDRSVTQHQNKMIREVERLGKLCHDHLMTPVGFVIYEDVALVLHEHIYMSNGSLAQLIHENTKKLEYEPDWPTRLSIANGVAQGLAFLHSVAVIHLDISSGNILLDANMSPRVAEIEISKLLDPCRGTASISAVAGSFGYIPPEYAYTMQVTAPGNVYSYGVILLEILTTRGPVDEDFGEGIDLVKWVQNAAQRGETPEQILDARLSTVSYAWRKEMLATLRVALQCTESTPAKRPKMNKVIEMLQEIKE